MNAVDWSDVYTATDVDVAVEIFTEKFNSVLNQHAPWIMYQQRKFFCPWLTDSTEEQMEKRDMAKKRAKELAMLTPGVVTEEQKKAWNEFKY